jgi:hypothetical protein
MTPKYFAAICRFYQAYALKESQLKLDWLSIAVQTGYHDYQHMVKDFKTFAGTTPNILVDQSLNNLLEEHLIQSVSLAVKNNDFLPPVNSRRITQL